MPRARASFRNRSSTGSSIAPGRLPPRSPPPPASGASPSISARGCAACGVDGNDGKGRAMSGKKDDAAIKVRRQWNDRRRIATYRLGDISELQWGRTSGGVQARTPQPFVHGYVMCDAMIGGKLAHSCSHGPAPHRIKVCLTRKGNESVWKEVLAIVGPSPGRPRRQPGGRTISSPMSLRTTPAAQAQSFPADGNDGKGRATSSRMRRRCRGAPAVE